MTSSARLRISPTGIAAGGFSGGIALGAVAPPGAGVPGSGVLGAAVPLAGAIRPGIIGICAQASVITPRHRAKLASDTTTGFLRDSS